MARTTPGSEIDNRINRLFDILDGRRLGAAVLDRRDDQYYYTGYTGSDAWLVLLTKRRQAVLVTDSRYSEEAEKSARHTAVELWKKSPGDQIGRILKKSRVRKAGYLPGTLTVATHLAMVEVAGNAVAWLNVEPDIAGMRSVKSQREVDAIAEALRIAHEAYLASKKRWKAGMTEIEVKNDLEWEMRQRGADGVSFETIVAAGANASLPHAHSGDRPITKGKMLLLDFGVKRNRYCSDTTRTLWWGSIPKVWEKRYQEVLAAQRAGIEACRAGIECRQVDRTARQALRAGGLDKYFTHGLGHGVGLAIHESPRLSPKSDATLTVGNVVTVEPGVYFPGAGGIRIEDMVVIGENGPQVLGNLPKDISDIVV